MTSAAGGEAAERRERVLAALVEAGDAGVSGEALAEAMDTSRRRCTVTSRAATRRPRHPQRARRLPTARGADPVVPLLVTPRLRAPLAGPLTWLPETGSTNEDLIALARDGAAEGTVIGADIQTAGRGRRGRSWMAARGHALLVSALLRPGIPPVDAGLLPIVAAVGAADALGPDARIVWPNDILIDGRKVAGILCEMSADQEGVAWAVVGVGINVRSAPDLDDARWNPGALADIADPPTRADLLVRLLGCLGDRYREWAEDGAGARWRPSPSVTRSPAARSP